MTSQRWEPQRYARNAGFVAELGTAVVELLAPRPGERVLDLGCGDGVLTRKLAESGCDVVGVDASAEQVEAARGRGLDARVCDAAALGFEAEFDAVFSNAALHWVKRADAVVAGVYRALRPLGRFVGELGGRGNVARIEAALAEGLARRGIDLRDVHPWYFPDAEEYRALLEAGGFDVEVAELIDRPTVLPGHMAGWLETFAESFSNALPEIDRSGYLEEVVEALRPTQCDGDGRWCVDYVRLRFRARKRAV